MFRYALLLVALAWAYTQSYALRTVNAVLAPTLSQEMALSNTQLGMLTSAYFIAFFLMQIPLGPLLDRYGARKVECVLLLFAALGALVYALAEGFYGLLIGRLLIGMGVSACLMAAFKCFREQFALSRQGTLSIFMLFFGSLGALISTTPAHAIVELWGWRPLFLGMAMALTLGALLVALYVPTPINQATSDPTASLTTSPTPASYRQILLEPLFWQSVPVYFVMVGGYMALQSLWCGPWLVDTVGYSPKEAAQGLQTMAFAQIISYGLIGFFIAPWAGRHKREGLVVRWSFALAVASLILAMAYPTQWGLFGLAGFAVFFSINTLSQTLVNAVFPAHLVGRSSTASNFLIFAGAFFFQWCAGFLVDAFVAHGLNRGQALNQTFMVIAVLMMGAWLWYVLANRTERGWAYKMAQVFRP